jgi:hypothetical protein
MQVLTAERKIFSVRFTAERKICRAEFTAERKMFGWVEGYEGRCYIKSCMFAKCFLSLPPITKTTNIMKKVILLLAVAMCGLLSYSQTNLMVSVPQRMQCA